MQPYDVLVLANQNVYPLSSNIEIISYTLRERGILNSKPTFKSSFLNYIIFI